MTDPSALILTAPRTLAFEPIEDQPLAADAVRIKTLFSGISAGTELTQYRGTSPFMQRRWDEGRRLFVDSDGAPSRAGRGRSATLAMKRSVRSLSSAKRLRA